MTNKELADELVKLAEALVAKKASAKKVSTKRPPAKKKESTRRIVAKRRRRMKESDDDKDAYVRYLKDGKSFTSVGDVTTAEILEPSVYESYIDFSGNPVFTKFKPHTDALLKFKSSVMEEVIQEVETFWGLKENFNKLGFLHHRGILLYGPPGAGKTCLIHQVAEMMIENENTVLIGKNIGTIKSSLTAFRQIEPDRKIVVVLEDMDEYIGYEERATLQLLDGADSFDNVLYIGTTNYRDKFPPRLLRPGRFDKLVEVGMPPIEGRLAYLHNKLDDIITTEEIQDIAERTEGFSFGHLRELVIAAFAFKEDLDKAIKRLGGVSCSDLAKHDIKKTDALMEQVKRGKK